MTLVEKIYPADLRGSSRIKKLNLTTDALRKVRKLSPLICTDNTDRKQNLPQRHGDTEKTLREG